MKCENPLRIRLVSHNIRYATRSPFKGEELWAVRLPRVLSQFQFLASDNAETIVCLQEVLHGQLVDILNGLNQGSESWSYIGVGRDDGREAGEYSCILYRSSTWKLLHHECVWLSETPWKPSKSWDAALPRILTIGRFIHRENGQRLVAMCTHLDHQGSRSRLEAAKIISKMVEKFAEYDNGESDPVVVAGDFNSETTMEAYQYLKTSSNLVDVQSLKPRMERYGNHNTFTGFQNEDMKRIDFLFVRDNDKFSTSPSLSYKQWQVENYAVMDNCFDDGIYLSDHRAVVADTHVGICGRRRLGV
jgi:endonuclease/exonuclease/phosphatase family metal-dependent hydrolase